MSNFEEKDAITNACFDAFMEQQGIVIVNEESRALLYEVFIGGMAFMVKQIQKKMIEVVL